MQSDEFDPHDLYDQYPSGASIGFGPDQGYNVFRKLNDPALFTEEAKADPVIAGFLDAPFSLTYVQLKSSTREAEYFIHKPHLAFAGEVPGMVGAVDGFPSDGDPHIGTYVINHDKTLAIRPIRSLIIEDRAQAGQMIYKGDGPSA